MAEEEFDPFKFHTGLPDDFDGEIDDAYFMYDPEYNDGQTLLLKLELKTEDVDLQEMLKRPIQYSVGGGFSPVEGGAAIERTDGTKKGFHVNSAIANLLTAMLGCDGAEKVLRDKSSGRGNPFRADFYIGLNWHWDRQTFHYGGDIGDKDRLMPSKFIGVKGASGGTGMAVKAAGPVKKVAKKSTAPTPVAPAVEELPPDAAVVVEGGPLWNQLWGIAMSADDHGKFVEGAFEIPAVADDEAVQQFVLDDGPESMWQKAVDEYEATQQG